MTAESYWEDRAGIITGPATARRAAECFAEAQANEHATLKGTLKDGFTYWAAYHPTCGRMVRVTFTPIPANVETTPWV